MAKRKWPAGLIIKFLEGYESYPCLWDVHSSSYKSRDGRESAYQKLCELMDIEGFGIAEVKAKIRSIRNAYALEATKIKKSQHWGAGADEVYKPKVPWFSVADRILKYVVQIRETQVSQIKIESQSDLDDSLENTQSATIEIVPTSSNESSVARKPVAPKLTSNFTAPKRARKRKKAIQGLQEIAQKLDQTSTREEDNEFDCFGKSVAFSLKKLPESIALESMEYIQSYLVRRRLSNIQHSHQISRPSSSASSSTYENAANPCSNRSNDDDK